MCTTFATVIGNLAFFKLKSGNMALTMLLLPTPGLTAKKVITPSQFLFNVSIPVPSLADTAIVLYPISR